MLLKVLGCFFLSTYCNSFQIICNVTPKKYGNCGSDSGSDMNFSGNNCLMCTSLYSTSYPSLERENDHDGDKLYNQQQQPWTVTKFDYSAANEYVKAHYGDKAPSDPYFTPLQRGGEEMVYNARHGVITYNDDDKDLNNYKAYSLKNATLSRNGFALCKHDSPTKITDFHDLTMIKDVYIDELEQLLKKELNSSSISHISFWNPMIRGEELTIQARDDNSTSTPTASIANMVHIDTDIGAYSDIRDIVMLIEKNRLHKNSKNDDNLNEESIIDFDAEQIIRLLENGHRFAIVNFWRNIHSEPITHAPLSILCTQYDTTSTNIQSVFTNMGTDTKATTSRRKREEYTCFPYAVPDPKLSRWYTFPHMTKDECLMFYQYDRLVSQLSDLWHCALTRSEVESESHKNDEQHQPRKSFDIRAFIVFDEIVPTELDRFHSYNRLRPILSFEESGCFCDEQAAKRNV